MCTLSIFLMFKMIKCSGLVHVYSNKTTLMIGSIMPVSIVFRRSRVHTNIVKHKLDIELNIMDVKLINFILSICFDFCPTFCAEIVTAFTILSFKMATIPMIAMGIMIVTSITMVIDVMEILLSDTELQNTDPSGSIRIHIIENEMHSNQIMLLSKLACLTDTALY